MSRYEKSLIESLRCISWKTDGDIKREDLKTIAEGLAELLKFFDNFEMVLEMQTLLNDRQAIMQAALAGIIKREAEKLKSDTHHAAVEEAALPLKNSLNH